MITPEQAVDAINERFGRHERSRALHAKGVVLKGTFTATPAAARLTRAGHMQGDPVPATVRVSNGSGDPSEPDYAPDVRGMAVKFYLPDGSRADISGQTATRFPTTSVDAFIDFVSANAADASRLWKLPLFLVRHPKIALGLPAGAAALKAPASYATLRYYALHAFKWVDADGGERWVRYTWEPEAGVQTISGKEAKANGRDYLRDEILARVAREPARFTLRLQIAGVGDDPDDPTKTWPASRETVAAGTLELTEPDTEREKGDDVLVFDPTRVVDGIELSNDPILRFRSPAYSASIERRSGVSAPASLDDVSGPK
jgi:catalase